jgi:acetyltransferase-like isoleucine patch superfamily enzyme
MTAQPRARSVRRGLLRRLYLLTMRRESLKWIGLRRRIFDQLLGRKHRDLWIHPEVYVDGFEGLRLGDDVSINRGSNIAATGGLTIGDHVSIAHAVTVLTVEHGFADPDIPIKRQPIMFHPVTIGNNVWIGARVCILGGVTLANGTIVAAGSVVKHSVTEENCTIAGVPARIVKRRGAAQASR